MWAFTLNEIGSQWEVWGKGATIHPIYVCKVPLTVNNAHHKGAGKETVTVKTEGDYYSKNRGWDMCSVPLQPQQN